MLRCPTLKRISSINSCCQNLSEGPSTCMLRLHQSSQVVSIGSEVIHFKSLLKKLTPCWALPPFLIWQNVFPFRACRGLREYPTLIAPFTIRLSVLFTLLFCVWEPGFRVSRPDSKMDIQIPRAQI